MWFSSSRRRNRSKSRAGVVPVGGVARGCGEDPSGYGRMGGVTRIVGWVVTLLLVVAAVVSLDPARVGLSTVVPVAQILPFRTVLAAAFLLAGLAMLVGKIIERIMRFIRICMA